MEIPGGIVRIVRRCTIANCTRGVNLAITRGESPGESHLMDEKKLLLDRVRDKC